MVFNKAKEIKPIKIIELIHFIKSQKKKQANQVLNNLIEIPQAVNNNNVL